MRFSPVSVSDVLEWIEAFASNTGLSSTISALIHAELCYYPSATILFLEVSQRELMLDSLEHTNEEKYEELLDQCTSGFDERIKEFDEGAYQLRMSHYNGVLKHHGFTQVFIDALIDNLSPSSECIPSVLEVEKVFEDSGFNDRPVFVIVDECFHTDEDEETHDDAPEPAYAALHSVFHQMMDHQRLERPVNPAGWVALMSMLGFKIVEGSVSEEYTVGIPSFVVDDHGHVPVFIVGATRTAFDDEDDAGQIMKNMVQTLLQMSTCTRALLFYGSPSIIADDNDMKEGLVFWGEVFGESAWGEMILHQDTHTVDRIIADSKIVTRGLETFDKTAFRDKGLALMNHWMENHVYTA
jgi:hypothetical protein